MPALFQRISDVKPKTSNLNPTTFQTWPVLCDGQVPTTPLNSWINICSPYGGVRVADMRNFLSFHSGLSTGPPFVIQIRRLCDPSRPLLHSLLPETLWQLDHLSFYYLNTCKKICLNFPLCFWSGLLPVFPCSPTELPFGAKWFLSVSGASWMRCPTMHCALARGLCQFTPLLTANTCCDPSFLFFLAVWRPPYAKHTDRAQTGMCKRTFLSLFTRSRNNHSVTACRGWNKGTSGDGQ